MAWRDLKRTDELKGFSKEAAEELIGSSVTKRVLVEENPAVKPGQFGKVVKVEKSKIAESYAVSVDWGDREIWVYDTPEDFEQDVRIDDEILEHLKGWIDKPPFVDWDQKEKDKAWAAFENLAWMEFEHADVVVKYFVELCDYRESKNSRRARKTKGNDKV